MTQTCFLGPLVIDKCCYGNFIFIFEFAIPKSLAVQAGVPIPTGGMGWRRGMVVPGLPAPIWPISEFTLLPSPCKPLGLWPLQRPALPTFCAEEYNGSCGEVQSLPVNRSTRGELPARSTGYAQPPSTTHALPQQYSGNCPWSLLPLAALFPFFTPRTTCAWLLGSQNNWVWASSPSININLDMLGILCLF